MEKKRKIFAIIGAAAILLIGLGASIPFIILSNQPKTQQPGGNDSGDLTPPEPPTPPKPPRQEFQHSLTTSEISKITSPFALVKQTPKIQKLLASLPETLKTLNNGNQVDFMYSNDENIAKELFKLLKDIGYYGDIGSTELEKMMYTPRSEQPTDLTTQNYLASFSSSDATGATKQTANIEQLIKANVFGYLPSNLSQLLFFMDLESIGQLFNIKNVTDIKANFNDNVPTIDILITDQNNQKYLFNFDKANTNDALKCDKDFRQYIYDRTVNILVPQPVEFKKYRNPAGGKTEFILEKHSLTGTGFILDRVLNPNLGPDQYEFLVATNMHVLNFAPGYNKNRDDAIGGYGLAFSTEHVISESAKNNTYNTYWDGGLYYKGDPENGGAGHDNITTTNVDGTKIQVIEQPRNLTANNCIRLKRPTNQDVDQVKDQNGIATIETNTNINQTNVIDAVWYTPEFSTTGIWSTKDVNYPIFDIDENEIKNKDLRTAYKEVNGRYAGNTSNAGADFVVTRIVLNANDVQSILPSLFPLLNTPQEKDWYPKLGTNNTEVEVAANSTLFSGGYPSGIYSDRKWNSGRILAQTRYFDNEKNSLLASKYWTRYDEAKNNKFNAFRGLNMWYKTQHPKMRSMSEEQNNKYNPHGMEIEKLIQMPLMTVAYDGTNDPQHVLEKGSSGSMVINSRFELVGSLFQFRKWQEGRPEANNIIQLFKQYSQQKQNFSIFNDIKKQLNNQGLNSISLNPR